MNIDPSWTWAYPGPHTQSRTFRLLHITSRSPDYVSSCEADPLIECTSETKQLGSCPHTALSYTWGPEYPSHSILLDGQTTHVRDNLCQFLRYASSSPRLQATAFWIDALCINQQDVKDRNQQVRQMGEIYARAEKVIIWLGVAPGEVAAFASALGRLCMKRERLQREGILALPNCAASTLAICQMPYWTRTWIVQEVLLARKLEIVCDRHHFPLASFSNVIDLLLSPASNVLLDRALSGSTSEDDLALSLAPRRSVYRQQIYASSAYQHIRSRNPETRVERTPIAVDWRPGFDLCELLQKYAATRCSDIRDRVFSLLSLVTKGPAFGVQYNDTVLDLIIRACRYFYGDARLFGLLVKSLQVTDKHLKDYVTAHSTTTAVDHVVQAYPFRRRPSMSDNTANSSIDDTSVGSAVSHDISCQSCGVALETKYLDPKIAPHCHTLLCLDGLLSNQGQHVFGIRRKMQKAGVARQDVIEWVGPVNFEDFKKSENKLARYQAFWAPWAAA